MASPQSVNALMSNTGATGAGALATVSALASLALDVAEQIGLPVACLGPGGKPVWFSAR